MVVAGLGRSRSGFLRRMAWVLALAVCLCGMRSAHAAAGGLPPLDLQARMLPIPEGAAFHDPGYYVWCGTMVQGKNGKYHLYYSRWKISDGFESWVTRSEIAHAVGDSPTGPFRFHDVVLAARGAGYWDGTTAHNPTVHEFEGKYYLYYMGDTGDGKIMPTINWNHRNNQRIGVAIADNPNGPWRRFDKPLLDVSADPSAPDSLCVNNPGVTRGRDGRYWMLYKAVGQKEPLPIGGPVVHMMAVADSPAGPFRKLGKPLFQVAGNRFPFEDPFFWFDRARDRYFVIIKDNHGVVSGTGASTLLLYESQDGIDWRETARPLVSNLELHWAGRSVQHVKRMERPQLLFDRKGRPIVLIVAIDDGGSDTYNVRIPLRPEA